MAEHLASLFGTEKDRVNCPFYFKIGACRHGDRCSRAHNKPSVSPTLLLRNLYENRAAGSAAAVTARDARGLPASAAASSSSASQADFEAFYEDVFEELAKYGRLDALNVCDNVADHLVGAVYAQWADEASAAAAHADLNGRFYEGRPIVAEFSPVTDFREATCRQYEERTCTRGGYCNFMHLRPVSRSLRRRLFGRYVDDDRYRRHADDDDRRRRRSRSRSPRGDRDRGRARSRDEPPRRRESSAERRAKIAAWNAEAAAAAGGGG